MKKIFLLISLASGLMSQAQPVTLNGYGDSLITVTATQRGAIYAAAAITGYPDIANTKYMVGLKNYVGTTTQLDSVFTVTIKAKFLMGMLELLYTMPDGIVGDDRKIIINNSTGIPGYTGLQTQILQKANGNGADKQVAIFLKDFYLQRDGAMTDSRTEFFSNIKTAVNTVVQ